MSGDPAWCTWTLVIAALPGVIKFLSQFSLKYWKPLTSKENPLTRKEKLIKICLFLPKTLKVALLFQLDVARKFYMSAFENDYTVNDDVNPFIKKVNEALSLKAFEAFIESPLQMCLQTYIMFSQGSATTLQIFTLTTSFLTLCKASADNHFIAQSSILETNFVQAVIMLPIFLLVTLGRVFTIALVLAYNIGLLLPPTIFLVNIFLAKLLLHKISLNESLQTAVCSLLTTTVVRKHEKDDRKTQSLPHLLLFYACQTPVASLLCLVGLITLAYYSASQLDMDNLSSNISNTDFHTNTTTVNGFQIPLYQHFEEFIITLMLLHLISTLITLGLFSFYKKGRGIKLGTIITETSTTIQATDNSCYNYPHLSPGYTTDLLPPGTTVVVVVVIYYNPGN